MHWTGPIPEINKKEKKNGSLLPKCNHYKRKRLFD